MKVVKNLSINLFKVNKESARDVQVLPIGIGSPSSLALVCARKSAPLVIEQVFVTNRVGFTVWRWDALGEPASTTQNNLSWQLSLTPWVVHSRLAGVGLVFTFVVLAAWVWIMLADNDGRLTWLARDGLRRVFSDCCSCLRRVVTRPENVNGRG